MYTCLKHLYRYIYSNGYTLVILDTYMLMHVFEYIEVIAIQIFKRNRVFRSICLLTLEAFNYLFDLQIGAVQFIVSILLLLHK